MALNSTNSAVVSGTAKGTMIRRSQRVEGRILSPGGELKARSGVRSGLRRAQKQLDAQPRSLEDE